MHPPPFRLQHHLSDWPDCQIETRCRACGDRVTIMPVKLLVQQMGNLGFGDLVARMRCRECRGKPSAAYLVAGHHRTHQGGPLPDWSIELIPPSRSGKAKEEHGTRS